jgi:hypothetical protein
VLLQERETIQVLSRQILIAEEDPSLGIVLLRFGAGRFL